MNKTTKSFRVHGMHCRSCESAIESEISGLNGVFSVKANHKTSNVVVDFDPQYCNENLIKSAINTAGYSTSKENNSSKFVGLLLIVFAILFLSKRSLFGFDTNAMLENSSLIMLFIVGILTSLHCVGMCGGIMLTQTLDKEGLIVDKKASFNVALKYNLGRVISYTLLGGIIGAVGSVFSLSMKAQGFIQIIASLFMIFAGLNMFGFKLFKNINLNIPLLNSSCKKNNNTPFIVGLLNGFMPCGALQTMQLYALGTGSFTMGALSMFIFSIGTVPLMLGFGYVSSRMSRGLSNKIFKYSGIFIIVLGLSMAQRGFALTGFSLPIFNQYSQAHSSELPPVVDGFQEITLTVDRYGYTPSTSVIKGDIPVRLTIDVKEVTSCNSPIYFPAFDQYLDLSNGNVVVEIDTQGEDLFFTCWMGMLRGKISVI